jgi:urease accessory protein
MATGTEAAGPAAAPAVAPTPPLLALLWLASPALPVGGFSYSEALETAVEAGTVHDETSAGAWLASQLALTQARSELPLTAAALRGWRAGSAADIEALNTWALVTRESAELRLQTEQMGRSMAQWLQQRQPEDPRVALLAALQPAPAWPLAFALAAAHSGAGERDALLAMAFGWAENAVQSAVKAVPLGQNAGQRLLGALARDIPGAVDEALQRDAAGQRQAFAPMAAVLSAQHETQYSRLFRS